MRLRALMIACLFGAPVFAGGAWLSFNDPKTSADPLAVGALTTVKLVVLSGEKEFTEITGAAEGLVDGQRISIPLVLEKLSRPGSRSVCWKPPAAGQWVLAFAVRIGPKGNPGMAAVVKVNSDGVKRQLVLLNLGLSWTPLLIDSAFTGAVPTKAAVLRGAWRVPE